MDAVESDIASSEDEQLVTGTDETAEHRPHVNDLPEEILIEIFSYLNVEEITFSVRHTCWLWRQVTFANSLWSKVPFIPSPYLDSHGNIFIIPQCYLPFVQVIEIHHSLEIERFLHYVTHYFNNIKTLKYKIKNGVDFSTAIKLLQIYPDMRCLETFYFGIHLDYAQIFGKHYKKNRVNIITTDTSEIIHLLTENKSVLNTLIFQEKLTREIFLLICDCLQLRHLIINCVGPWYEAADFRHLMRLKNLKSLQVRRIDSSITTTMVNCFEGERLPNLTKIEIIKGGRALEKSLNTLLAACPNLKHLNVYRNILTDECLENIRLCHNLEYLDVSENFQLSDQFLNYIALGCHRLKFLDITNCRCITDAFLMILHPCIQLEILCIEGFEFHGTYFNMIPNLYPKLLEFHVRHFRDRDVLECLNLRAPGLRTIRCVHDHHF